MLTRDDANYGDTAVNYAKIDYKYRSHHARFKRFIESHRPRLTCQECGGEGGWREIIDPELGGPWYDCGWCEGTGYMTPWARGFWLRSKREEKCRAVPIRYAPIRKENE